MSASWNWFIVVVTTAYLLGLVWLLFANARKSPGEADASAGTGHVWDGDISELNNPLPRWWFIMFVMTMIFTVVYLAVYPGFGKFAGTFGWTSAKEMQSELDDTRAKLESLYAGFRDQPLAELANNAAAVKVGRNVFANNCAACHGTDARGAKGYPNLVDGDWLYGGEPDTVLASVLHGRHGLMPPMIATLPGTGIDEVSNYVLGLSGLGHDRRLAAAGKPRFEAICGACHGIDGKGSHALGAPNLTDDIWLHGNADLTSIRDAISYGRRGVMPPWGPIIGEDRARLAVAWLLAQGVANAESSADATPAGAQ